MRIDRLIAHALVATGLCLVAAPAHAVTFTFAEPPGVPTADTPTSVFVLCDGSGLDRCSTTMTFSSGGLAVTASAFDFIAPIGTRHIIQDRSPDDGGLGVVDSFSVGTHGGNDNVSAGDVLVLTFDESVLLTSVGFSDDHDFSFPMGSNVLFSTDDVTYTSYALAASIGFSTTGTTFYFKHGGEDKDDFYISGLKADPSPIPEPTSVFLTGAGVLGLLGRARRRTRR